MSDGPNDDDVLLLGINNRKGKPPKKETSRIVLSDRPSFRSFANSAHCSIKLFYEVCRSLRATLEIPHHGALNICARSLVVADTANVHFSIANNS